MKRTSFSRPRHSISQEKEQLDKMLKAEMRRSARVLRASSQETKLELLSMRFQQEAVHLRDIEQILKENLDWYTPLEDMLGVPVIGIDTDEFIASVENNEDVRIHADGIHEDRLLFEIRPEHIEHCNIDYGAMVNVYVLPDRTLRPEGIYNYNRISSYDPETDSDSGVHIQLIGRSEGVWSYNWRKADIFTMAVLRYTNYPSGRPETCVYETYDTGGRLIPEETKPY